MKRTFTFTMASMLVLISAAATAHPGPHHRDQGYANGSSLELWLIPRGTYTVIMDGVRYYNVRDVFQITGLLAGTHQIRIIEYFGHHRRGTVVYNGYINIPYRASVQARITPHNRIMIQHVDQLPPVRDQQYRHHPHHGHGHYHYRRQGQGYHRNY